MVTALEATLLNNLGLNGFTLKLGNFGKFSVRHKPGIRRKVGLGRDHSDEDAVGQIVGRSSRCHVR